MTNATTTYSVSFSTKIDRPELRGPSFSPVKVGTYVPTTITTTKFKSAVALFSSILNGEEDFSSEYVVHAQVWADGPKGRRTVRTLVHRSERDGEWLPVT